MNLKNITLFIFCIILLQFAIYTIEDKPVVETITIEEFEKYAPKLTQSEKKFEELFFNLNREMTLLKNSAYFKNFVKDNIYKVEIEDLFLYILGKVPELSQLRYIDQNGNEIIRAQRNLNSIYLTPKNQLQNKKHRYYFKKIMESTKNQMWVSRIDANMENGIIDFPENRTLRIGIPVSINKEKKGILVANIIMKQFDMKEGEFLQSFRTNILKSIYIAF